MDVVEQIEAILDRATQDFDGRDEIMRCAADEITRLRSALAGYGKCDAELAVSERALAERAGGVKVCDHEWEKTHEDLCMFVCARCREAFTGNVIDKKPHGWSGKYQPQQSTTEPAAPEGGRGAVDWRRVDDALVSCASLLRTLCRDEIGDTAAAELEYVRSVLTRPAEQAVTGKFALGDRVTKLKGSSWTGRVVGFYSTALTPIGYAVESDTETGSVQIYPQAALKAAMEAGR